MSESSPDEAVQELFRRGRATFRSSSGQNRRLTSRPFLDASTATLDALTLRKEGCVGESRAIDESTTPSPEWRFPIAAFTRPGGSRVHPRKCTFVSARH